MLKIELMPDLSEVIPYEQARIPLYIRTADLSIYWKEQCAMTSTAGGWFLKNRIP